MTWEFSITGFARNYLQKRQNSANFVRIRTTGNFAVVAALALSACNERPVSIPPAPDLAALVEEKPVPTEAILTDPGANDRYNASLEAAFDRVHSAALRVCQFYKEVAGVDCAS